MNVNDRPKIYLFFIQKNFHLYLTLYYACEKSNGFLESILRINSKNSEQKKRLFSLRFFRFMWDTM